MKPAEYDLRSYIQQVSTRLELWEAAKAVTRDTYPTKASSGHVPVELAGVVGSQLVYVE